MYNYMVLVTYHPCWSPPSIYYLWLPRDQSNVPVRQCTSLQCFGHWMSTRHNRLKTGRPVHGEWIHEASVSFVNAPAVSLVHKAFDDTGSLGSPRYMVYPPGSIVPSWVTASRFLAGNREAELKSTTFSSLLLFRDFLSFLFSWPPSDIVP